MDGRVHDRYVFDGVLYLPKTVKYNFDITDWISSTVFAENQNKKSASSLIPSVEYDLKLIPEFLITFSTSLADSSFARSAIHLHFGSTLKNEKLKKYCSLSFVSIIFVKSKCL